MSFTSQVQAKPGLSGINSPDGATAKREGYREADEKWQCVVTDLHDTVAEKDAEIARLRAMIEGK